ncbi:hypothetical protein M501DRAFT_393702 [Patellaria atrata CBS 101060]|uniref:Xylanolytic transcriptional activator regulatory domain-containing protein n=1 Tax=Patellaria atrata CBS 101060 TaxID=1346257 RepID=A0A9P4SI08_9PEZI|nr:hypothetical protein M501DRAFT_393702 [Patellaria atrata CBS 101060]
MRSSIACTHCRRSKVNCQYPTPGNPGAITIPSRRESVMPGQSLGNTVNEPESSKKQQRSRKAAQPGPSSSGLQYEENLLNIDPDHWKQLFNIFELHYSTELPFLHKQTFLKPLHKSHSLKTVPDYGYSNDDSKVYPKPAADDVTLLAFLALTVRFHRELTQLHGGDAISASKIYADAAWKHAEMTIADFWQEPNLQRTQALLMLAVLGSGSSEGKKAWGAVCNALLSARALGLTDAKGSREHQNKRAPPAHTGTGFSGHGANGSGYHSNSEDAIAEEIERRTFWSCYIMHTYLANGVERQILVQPKDIKIQLPLNQNTFNYGRRAQTLFLGDNVQDEYHQGPNSKKRKLSDNSSIGTGSGKTEPESLLSLYIRAVDLYGEIARWSLSGGRRIDMDRNGDPIPPWTPESAFYKLHSRLLSFKERLPESYTYNIEQTGARGEDRISTPYTLMHTVLDLSGILLHREYVPCIALKCPKGPEGPLDNPKFTPKQLEGMPNGWWEQSAGDLFKAARRIVDLLRECQEYELLPETPIVAYAAHIVAFVGVYAQMFPHMDQAKAMFRGESPYGHNSGANSDTEPSPEISAVLSILRYMAQRMTMARVWQEQTLLMFKELRSIKDKEIRLLAGGREARRGSILNDEGIGEGGIKIWEDIFSRKLSDMLGFHTAEEIREVEGNGSLGRDDNSSDDRSTVKSEAIDTLQESSDTIRRQQASGFTSINTTNANGPSTGPADDQRRSSQHPMSPENSVQQSHPIAVNLVANSHYVPQPQQHYYPQEVAYQQVRQDQPQILYETPTLAQLQHNSIHLFQTGDHLQDLGVTYGGYLDSRWRQQTEFGIQRA